MINLHPARNLQLQRRLSAFGDVDATHQRGFILLAVMVIMGSVLLIATSVVFLTRAELAGAATATDAARSRALAWSGGQMVVHELNEQRDGILRGEIPRLKRQYIIYDRTGEQGVVRMLPVGKSDAFLVPEASKIDLNYADTDTLSSIEMIDTELAERIIAHRDETLGRPFQSIAELLEVEGVSPQMLYGPLEEITPSDDATLRQDDLQTRMASLNVNNSPRGLADLVTVYSFEPNLQNNGNLRINLNVEWSEELAERVNERFGEGTSDLLKPLFDQGVTFDSQRKLFEILLEYQVPVEDWPEIIDALTATDAEYVGGRFDINQAPAAALQSLPGIDEVQAAQIVQARDRLPEEQKTSIVWPALQGIAPAQTFADLGGRLTTRSWTYRVRIAAGTVDPQQPDGPLIRPLIQEMVIDLSAPQPRIAYLREITQLQSAATMVATTGDSASADEKSTFDQSNESESPSPGEDDQAIGAEQENEETFAPASLSPLSLGSTPFGQDPNDQSDSADQNEQTPGENQPSETSPQSPGASPVGRWKKPG